MMIPAVFISDLTVGPWRSVVSPLAEMPREILATATCQNDLGEPVTHTAITVII